jgi:5-methylcytosine-specific restriction endonuclease McrA
VAATKKQLLLGIVRTDSTFEKKDVRGEPCWVGKCIHCNARLVVSLEGESYGATVEHILPRTHGGTDDLENVALACARCNAKKGVHLDPRHAKDPRLVHVIELLRARRKKRWRDE